MTEAKIAPSRREPELFGQTVVLLGCSAGIGRETARQDRYKSNRREISEDTFKRANGNPR